MRRRRNMFQMKEQDKTSEELSKVEICKLPDKEFKVMIIKMLNKPRRRMNEYSEKFNKDLEIKEPNRAEEYNNWNKKYSRRNQQ